jgi:hypothetical protein
MMAKRTNSRTGGTAKGSKAARTEVVLDFTALHKCLDDLIPQLEAANALITNSRVSTILSNCKLLQNGTGCQKTMTIVFS